MATSRKPRAAATAKADAEADASGAAPENDAVDPSDAIDLDAAVDAATAAVEQAQMIAERAQMDAEMAMQRAVLQAGLGAPDGSDADASDRSPEGVETGGLAAEGLEIPPFSSAPAAQVAESALSMAAVQTACIVMTDAAQHLRRMSALAEATTTAALRQSLTSTTDDWVQAMDAAERSMATAIKSFSALSQSAVALARQPPASKADPAG